MDRLREWSQFLALGVLMAVITFSAATAVVIS